jgi:hypothetical protein
MQIFTILMALHWVEEVSMSQDEIDYFLAGRVIGRLSTIDKNGYPSVTPVWFYWDGKAIFCDLGKNRLTTRNLKRNPKCAFIVDIDERPILGIRPNMAKGVLMVGDAELYERKSDADREEAVQVGDKIMKISEVLSLIDPKYLPELDIKQKVVEHFTSQSTPSSYPLLQGETERLLLKIKPRMIRAWDFSKAPFR